MSGGLCPGCDDPIPPRYERHGVCHNCYGTTDDPFMPRTDSERTP